jgi:DNA polymerase
MALRSDPAIALLDWYLETGCDSALDDHPIDRFASSAREAAAALAPPVAPERMAAERQPAERRVEAPRPAEPPAPIERRLDQSARPPATRAEQLAPRRPPPDPISEARERAIAAAPDRPQPTAEVPGDGAVLAARAAASAAPDLTALRAALEGFRGCNLRLTARRLVFADGDPKARLMFVGEAPGREEEEQGLPFVGRSGRLLDRMLTAVGIARSSVYIANVVPWRPPGNRTPTPQETEICRPFIARQIELVDPEVIVYLGGAAAAALSGTTEGITRLRGRWLVHKAGTREIPAMATLHPAYLLRQPANKRFAWRDMLAVAKRLAALPAGDRG